MSCIVCTEIVSGKKVDLNFFWADIRNKQKTKTNYYSYIFIPILDCYDGSDEGWCDPQHDPNAAPVCDYANCSLPDCFCSVDGTLVPGGLDPKDVPQLIYITFDDAINDENWKLYQVCAKYTYI